MRSIFGKWGMHNESSTVVDEVNKRLMNENNLDYILFLAQK